MIIVELAGHLGADPEVRFSPSGQKITTLRIATNIRRQGKDETVWWRAVIFGDHLDKIISFLKKGSAAIVIGKMNPPTIYNDKAGHPQVQLEIIAQMIEFSPFGKSDRSGEQGAGQAQYQGGQSQYNESRQAPGRQSPEPTFAAPSYAPAGNYEAPQQYAPQPPFAHHTPSSSVDSFPEEETIPF